MANTQNLTVEQFSLLMGVFDALKECHSDVCMVNGKISQFPDDRQSLYQVDMSEFLSETSFRLSDLKSKCYILQAFNRTDKDHMFIFVDGDRITFGEGGEESGSVVTFTQPTEKHMKNRFLTESHVNDKIMFETLDVLFEMELDASSSRKIRTFATGLESNMVRFRFKNDTVDMRIISGDKSNTTFAKLPRIYLQQKLEMEREVLFPVNLFLFSESAKKMTLYKRRDEDKLFMKLEGYFSDSSKKNDEEGRVCYSLLGRGCVD